MSTQRGGENHADPTSIRSIDDAIDAAVVAVHQPAGEPLRFSGEKVVTRGVALGLDVMLQHVLWRLVEQIPIAERDYLWTYVNSLTANAASCSISRTNRRPPIGTGKMSIPRSDLSAANCLLSMTGVETALCCGLTSTTGRG